MKVALLSSLILSPSLTYAAPPPAACTSNEQCSITQRSRFPSGGSITDVKLCDCYAVSSIDPFDECEDSESCAIARCSEDTCAGLAAFCDESTESCRMMLVAEEDTAPPNSPAVADCSSLTTCNECLDNESCAHWTIGECMSSCMVADVACWTTTGGFADMTVDEICTKADNANKDSALCGSMKDCTSCLEATKSDGKSCMWFEDGGGFCDTGCNMIGCGTTDVSTCSGGGGGAGIAHDSTTSTSSTVPAGDGDGTTTTTTSTTAPPAGIDKIENSDSSGNTRNLFTFAWTSAMMAFVLSCVVA